MLRLLLPALLPSWRFFDTIAPSPRIQFALLATPDDVPVQWQEFRPRPARLSWSVILGRLLWNPRWNESLYMVSCAESILDQSSLLRENELLTRISNAIHSGELSTPLPPPLFLVVRIIVLERAAEGIIDQVRFVSSPRRLEANGKLA